LRRAARRPTGPSLKSGAALRGGAGGLRHRPEQDDADGAGNQQEPGVEEERQPRRELGQEAARCRTENAPEDESALPARGRPTAVGVRPTRRSGERAATVNIALPTPPAARRHRKTGKELARFAAPVVTATMSSPAVSTARSPKRSTSESPLKAEMKGGDEPEEREGADRQADGGGAHPERPGEQRDGRRHDPEAERDHERDDGEDVHFPGEFTASEKSHDSGSWQVAGGCPQPDARRSRAQRAPRGIRSCRQVLW
jgi:hypothetical protein